MYSPQSSPQSLRHKLLTAQDIDELEKLGIGTAYKFLKATYQDIQSVTKCNEHQVKKIKNDVYELTKVHKPSGIIGLDDFLDGGLRMGHVYEICGLFAAGKTKLCQTLSIRLANFGIGTLYVDINGDLYPLDMASMLMESEPEIILKLIRVERKIHDAPSLTSYLNFIINNKEHHFEYGLLIVDSITHFHVQRFHGDRTIRDIELRKCFKLLQRVANECNMCVLLTNLMLTKEENSRIDENFRIGLQINQWNPKLLFTRLQIEADPANPTSTQRKVTVLQSSYLDEETEVFLQLTDNGFI